MRRKHYHEVNKKKAILKIVVCINKYRLFLSTNGVKTDTKVCLNCDYVLNKSLIEPLIICQAIEVIYLQS